MDRRTLITGGAALAALSRLRNARADGFTPAPGISRAQLAQLQAATIQGFGDSITGGQSIYFPTNTDLTNVPAWAGTTVYAPGSQVKQNSYVFYTAGGGTSGSTPPTPGVPNDGGITWAWNENVSQKMLSSYLTWAEIFSNGRLIFDQSQGYGGVYLGGLKCIVLTAGSGYTGATVAALNNGATGTVQVTGGKVTGVTILNPGDLPTTCTITDSGGGAGATVAVVIGGTGTYGISGQNTTQMLQRIADVLNSSADIIVVHGGTNDVHGQINSITDVPTVTATAIANLRSMYEQIMAAGKRVIAIPITPANTLVNSPPRGQGAATVNRWIRAYCRGESWANPLGYKAIRLADVGVYIQDGTNATGYQPIGGTGGVAYAMTQDGIHPSNRGGAYFGNAVWLAAQGFLTASPGRNAPSYMTTDGYDATCNAGGNMLEGVPWMASTPYAQGSVCSNGGALYYCITAGTSASSVGPTGAGASIADGTVTWGYASAAPGRSNWSTGTAGTFTAATGVVYSGALCSGWSLTRGAGTASGTVTGAIENPWSSGQIGQRQSLVFSLGSGGVNDSWTLAPANNVQAKLGIVAGDLGVTPFYAEAEIEVSGVAELTGIALRLQGDAFYALIGSVTTGAGAEMMASSGEMISYPNSGVLRLRTQPMIIHALNTTLRPTFTFTFNASGGAGTATLTAKLNYVAVRRAYVD